jgi:hypothetical protein
MQTQCTGESFRFQAVWRRDVVARFDAGRTSSDGGLLLLREVASRLRLFERVAACFKDYRKESAIEHTVEELVAQRVYGVACGYEDLNDHDSVRDDALLAVAVGKQDLLGNERERKRDRGHALAGKSTLNRLELTPADGNASSRYKKVVYDGDAMDDLFVQLFLDAHRRALKQIVLDLDATDDPLHGSQEGRFFHGYYGHYCYLPLYVFCGDFLLLARLRPSNIDASEGALQQIDRIVSTIRKRWPNVQIVIRADSGFARDSIMSWCEENDVHFVLGLARNARLEETLRSTMEQALHVHHKTGEAVRLFKDFRYQTLDSWTRKRRVVGKAEQLPGKANPRFVVTSLGADLWEAKSLYEDLYCARGDMENRIKEQQLALFADRTSAHTLRANQLRLWFASLAYALVNELRRVGLRNTPLERAQADTIRTRLLKLAAIVHVTVRKVWVSLSSVFPLKTTFERVLNNLRRLPAPG